jgi:hypothetical protein
VALALAQPPPLGPAQHRRPVNQDDAVHLRLDADPQPGPRGQPQCLNRIGGAGGRDLGGDAGRDVRLNRLIKPSGGRARSAPVTAKIIRGTDDEDWSCRMLLQGRDHLRMLLEDGDAALAGWEAAPPIIP